MSFAGDFINFVALAALMLELTGSGRAVSLLIVCNTLPYFLVTPVAGAVADRLDRRRIMIGCDVSRAVLALGFILVHTTGLAWLAYPITVSMVVIAAFFGPASSAALPNLVTDRQLGAANTLSGASWGTMLAVGATLGGVVSHYFGRPAAFMLDAGSFVVSALLIASIRMPFGGRGDRAHTPEAERCAEEAFAEQPPPPERTFGGLADLFGGTLRDFAEGMRYARGHAAVLALLLIKTCWGVGAGVIALLSVIPVQVFKAGDQGIAVVYAARGIGAVLGPFLAHMLTRGNNRRMALLAALGVISSGIFYCAFAASPTLWWATFFVFVAHIGGGAQWVLSTTLLQKNVEDRVLGRISALDMGGITLTMTVSTLLVGWGIEPLGPRNVGLVAGGAIVVLGLLWLLRYGLGGERFERAGRPEEVSAE